MDALEMDLIPAAGAKGIQSDLLPFYVFQK
jgi:hypothetical protein